MLTRLRSRRGRAAILPALAVLAIALTLPAAAPAQTTLGSPLAQPPNANFGCETKPTITSQIFTGNYDFLPSGQPSCTWFQSGVIGSVDYSDPRTGSVPADGFITNVAVRSGPNPAALRIVIVRQIGGIVGPNDEPISACCAFVSETPPAGSPPLQPQPNTITNFPVSIPVERNIKGTSAVADYVGITGISGTGTLPLLSTGDNNILTGYTQGSPDAGFFYPRMGALESPGGGQRNNESIPNLEVLLRWTWIPASGVTLPLPPPPPPPPNSAAPTLQSQAARVAGGQALVKLICGGNAACEGQLELLKRGANRTALLAADRKATAYGKKGYSIAAGGTGTIKVKLNRKGKALLRKGGRAKVGMRLTPTGGAPVTSTLTLKP